MEKIEVRLAEECKQVFTELQTDLADLNSDFSQATIPYHSFDDYALKVLFPGEKLRVISLAFLFVFIHLFLLLGQWALLLHENVRAIDLHDKSIWGKSEYQNDL